MQFYSTSYHFIPLIVLVLYEAPLCGIIRMPVTLPTELSHLSKPDGFLRVKEQPFISSLPSTRESKRGYLLVWRFHSPLYCLA
jgi:hypothetical protein